MTSEHENNKRIAKNTLFLYFRMLITMIVGLYTSRVVLSSLGIEDYGLYNVVGGLVVLLSFLNGAMASSTQRYMNVELGRNSVDGLRKVYANSMLIHIGVAVVIVILSETIGLLFLNKFMNINAERFVAANWVYQFSIAAFVINILSVPYNAAIIAHEKMSAFAYISVVEVLLKLIVALLISVAPFDKLIFYALLIFLVGFVIRFIYAAYCKKYFEECRNVRLKKDAELLKNMMSFSSWTIFGNLAFIFHTQGIAIVINIFFGAAVNAAQGISNQVNGIVSGFVQNFMTAIKPQIVKNYAGGNLKEMHNLILSGSRLSFFLVLIFVVPISLEVPFFLSLWLKEVPEYTVAFIRILLFITLFDSFNSILNAAKGATGNIKIYMITQTSISMLHLPLAYLLFKFGYAPYYAMVVYFVLVIIMQMTRILFVCKAIGLSLKKFGVCVVLKCFAVFLVSFIGPLGVYRCVSENLFGFVLVEFVAVLSVIMSVFFVGLMKNERELLKTKIMSKFLKSR